MRCLETLKIELPPRRELIFYKIDVFALSPKIVPNFTPKIDRKKTKKKKEKREEKERKMKEKINEKRKRKKEGKKVSEREAQLKTIESHSWPPPVIRGDLGVSVAPHGRIVASRVAPSVDFRRFGVLPG